MTNAKKSFAEQVAPEDGNIPKDAGRREFLKGAAGAAATVLAAGKAFGTTDIDEMRRKLLEAGAGRKLPPVTVGGKENLGESLAPQTVNTSVQGIADLTLTPAALSSKARAVYDSLMSDFMDSSGTQLNARPRVSDATKSMINSGSLSSADRAQAIGMAYKEILYNCAKENSTNYGRKVQSLHITPRVTGAINQLVADVPQIIKMKFKARIRYMDNYDTTSFDGKFVDNTQVQYLDFKSLLCTKLVFTDRVLHDTLDEKGRLVSQEYIKADPSHNIIPNTQNLHSAEMSAGIDSITAGGIVKRGEDNLRLAAR